ncbi:hypothetical protein HY387_00870 [Candidatus Daviesbacteria bacterium]|nr:hypothetical protein [Candidatus Daviesbacteria bacterium]
MEKISINLLPREDAERQKQLAKFHLVQFLSTSALLVLVFLSSATAGLRIFQSQNITKANIQAQAAEEKIGQLKDKEVSLVYLKNRLISIAKVSSPPSKQASVYSLINKTIPPSIVVTALTVDKSANILISLIASNSASLSNLVTNLTSDQVFEKVAKIDIESLSRGKDGIFRANLKMVAR